MNHYQHHNNRNNNNRSPPPPSSGERIHVARVEKKRYPPCSNDHIIEATLMSGHQAPKITRASNTESATIDDGYIASTNAPSYSRCSEDRLLWSMDSSPKVNLHIHLFLHDQVFAKCFKQCNNTLIKTTLFSLPTNIAS